MSAIGAEQRGGQAERGSRHARRLHVHAVDVDEVVRHPKRQCDESAEDEEVVEREAPDLQVPEGRELLRQRRGFSPGLAAFDQFGVVLGQKEEQNADDCEPCRPDIGDTVPAVGDHDEGSDELGDSRADVARTEDAQRGPLVACVIPAADIGHADDERPAREANAKCCDQVHDVAVRQRECPCGQRCQDHLAGEHQPPAVFLGPDAEKQAGYRSGQNRGGDQKAELGVIQAKLGLDGDTDDGKDRPDRETGGEGDRAQTQGARLIGA